MRAREFIVEVSLENLAKTPIKGGMTLGQAVAQKMERDSSSPAEAIDAVEALELISAADPTNNNSMTKWLGKLFLTKGSGFRVPEDSNQVKGDLAKFAKLAKSGKLSEEQRDLNRIKTLNQLYDIIEQYDEEDMQSGKEKKAQIKHEGVDFIIDDPKFAIVHTKTHDANCFYGAGTKWCTTEKDNTQWFDEYSEQGPIYTVLDNSGAKPRKYQFHYESDQFQDERNEPVSDADIAQLSKNPGWAKFLNMQIEKHYGKYFEEA